MNILTAKLKTLILIYILLLTVWLTKAQNNYVNKIYIAEISTSCKETRDGGCTIYSYCILNFINKNYVEVSYLQKRLCSPSTESTINQIYFPKKHKWSVTNNKLSIKGFKDLKKYSFKEKNPAFFSDYTTF